VHPWTRLAWAVGGLVLLEVQGIVVMVIQVLAVVLDLAVLAATITVDLAALALGILVKGLVDKVIIVLVGLVSVNQEGGFLEIHLVK